MKDLAWQSWYTKTDFDHTRMCQKVSKMVKTCESLSNRNWGCCWRRTSPTVLQMFGSADVQKQLPNGILIAWERWWKMPGFGTTDPGIYSETHQCITCIKIHHFGLDKTIIPSHSWRSRRRRSWGASVRIVWFGCGLGCSFMEYAYMISPATNWLAAGYLKKWIYCKTIVSVDFLLRFLASAPLGARARVTRCVMCSGGSRGGFGVCRGFGGLHERLLYFLAYLLLCSRLDSRL